MTTSKRVFLPVDIGKPDGRSATSRQDKVSRKVQRVSAAEWDSPQGQNPLARLESTPFGSAAQTGFEFGRGLVEQGRNALTGQNAFEDVGPVSQARTFGRQTLGYRTPEQLQQEYEGKPDFLTGLGTVLPSVPVGNIANDIAGARKLLRPVASAAAERTGQAAVKALPAQAAGATSPEKVEQLSGLMERLSQLQEEVPLREESLKAHPLLNARSASQNAKPLDLSQKLIMQIGNGRGRPISDAAAKKLTGKTFDEWAQDLGYETGAVPHIGRRPDYEMRGTERLKHDLMEAHKEKQRIADWRRALPDLERQIADVEKAADLEDAAYDAAQQAKQTGGAVQAGMGMGEKPPQGRLFENVSAAPNTAAPLVDVEAQAARDARRAQVRAGQTALPETSAKPLMYDPATNRYNGLQLKPGDMLTDEAGARFKVDRANGFMVSADRIDQTGRPTGMVSFSVDSSDKARYAKMFPAEVPHAASVPEVPVRAEGQPPPAAAKAVGTARPTEQIRQPLGKESVNVPAATPQLAESAPSPSIAEPSPVPATQGAVSPPTVPPVKPPTPPTGGNVPQAQPPLSTASRFQLEDFPEPGNRLVGPETAFEAKIKTMPILKQVYGTLGPAAVHYSEPAAKLGIQKQVYEETQKARAHAAVLDWAAEAKPLLNWDKDGFTKNVQIAPNAQLGPAGKSINDIVENPARYLLSPEQSAAIAKAQALMKHVRDKEESIGVDVGEIADYWTRIITKSPSQQQSLLQRLAGKTGPRPSAMGHTRGRIFPTTDTAMLRGYGVNLDPVQSLTARLDAGIQAIANKEANIRIGQLPGVETPLSRVDPTVIKAAADARKAAQVAQVARGVINRMVRGERVPPNTVKQVADIYPAMGKEITDLLNLPKVFETGKPPIYPAGLSARVQALTQAADDAINNSSRLAQRAVNKRALAVEAASQPRIGERQILGKLAPQELVDEINKWIDVPGQNQTSEASRLTQDILQAWRSTMTSFDLGSAFIQTQSTITRNPIVWGKAVGGGLASIAEQPLTYVAKNYDVIDRGIKNGAISPPSEFLFQQKGLSSLPGKTPLLGKVFNASNRFMQWNVFVAQTELYKAAEGSGGKPLQELVSLSKAILHQTGGESYAVLGVRPGQRTAESIAFFAPRFMRAMTNTIFQAFTPGPGGNEARKTLGSVLGGVTALTYAISYRTTGKAPNFDDPYKEDWGRAKVGHSYVSLYGPFHNYFRTMARVEYSLAHGQPKEATKAVLGFFNSKSGLAIRSLAVGLDLLRGKPSYNYEGQLIDVSPQGFLNFLRDMSPITPANVIEGVAKGQPESLLNIANVNINPALEPDKRGKVRPHSAENLTPSYQQTAPKPDVPMRPVRPARPARPERPVQQIPQQQPTRVPVQRVPAGAW